MIQYFTCLPERRNNHEKEKTELLKLVEETTNINLHFIRQSHPKGLGHAVLQAKAFVGNEPFVVMLGDDLMDITNDDKCLTKDLIDQYNQTKASTVAVMDVDKQDVDKYGIIDPGQAISDSLFQVKSFVEKPKVDEAPSTMAIIGRYLLTPEIFEILESQKPGAGNEIQLTDAIQTLNKSQRVFAHKFTRTRYDVGDKFGFVQTSIEYGLDHPQIQTQLENYIIKKAEELKKERKNKS